METSSASMSDEGGTTGTGDVKERVSDGVSGAVEAVRAKTGNLQAGLADLLDSSAQVIRSKGHAAADTAGGASGDAGSERLVQTSDATAAVLERGAMWLRENDLSDVEARLTHQVKAHPTRTLLVAAGIGFLLSRRR
jgi:ElaB/YqjD/DUF883 family membrane-anchored ribosome-binding protein